MLVQELLIEMIWEDRFEAAKVARRYPNAWIHFAGRPQFSANDPPPVYKLGVNPSKGHRDPPGIYFYPVKFLFSDKASLSQFATEYKYFYIVNFNRSAKIINLGRMTMDQAEAIATANGWIDDLHGFAADRGMQADSPTLKNNPRLLRRPGGLFYATMDYLANIKGRPWLGMMKGYNGLIDPGYGIISGGEVAQAVVFGRQHVTILAQGENVDQGDREYANILKQLAEEMGGRFYFMHKLPSAEFPNDGRPFRVVLKLGWYKIEQSYYKQGFWMNTETKVDNMSGDRDSWYRDIGYYVRRAAQEAEEPPARPMYWDGDRVSQLLNTIRASSRILQRVGEDGLHAWQQIDSWGGIYAALRAIVSRDDEITIDAQIEMQKTVNAQVSQRFGQEPVGQIAKTILDELARQLIEQAAKPSALKTYAQNRGGIVGFRFTDQFDAV